MTPNQIAWTPALVEAELRGAMWTLRRIPSRHLLPAGIRVAWPEVLHTYAEAYGYSTAGKVRLQPSARQIADMDRALGWLWQHVSPAQAEAAGLPPDANAVVLMRSMGLSWERLGQFRLERWCAPKAGPGQRFIPGGNSVKSNRATFNAAIGHIVSAIGGAPVQVPLHVERPRSVVQGEHVAETRVVMASDEAGDLRPVVQTTHYRARHRRG